MKFIKPNVTVKDIFDTVPGELVTVRDVAGRPQLAIVLRREFPELTLGYLRPADRGGPVSEVLKNRTYCMSYGTEWALEPLPTADTWPGNAIAWHGPCGFALDGGHHLMRFQPLDPSKNEEWYDLDLMTGATRPEPTPLTLPFQWRIWEREELRHDDDAKPLFESHPKQIKPEPTET
ncbi:hypothetical protein [Mesorhizobium sp.]|jgi:hypothetical protein|uniref:hypothetical protein n=1 Tax=Mesorhizobium sp. TaxID=1871066 RepID=UPI00356B52AB